MLHTEMMYDLQGVFSLAETDNLIRVENGTLLDLTNTAVVRRTDANGVQAAWIGDLASGTISEELKFADVKESDGPVAQLKGLNEFDGG